MKSVTQQSSMKTAWKKGTSVMMDEGYDHGTVSPNHRRDLKGLF